LARLGRMGKHIIHQEMHRGLRTFHRIIDHRQQVFYLPSTMKHQGVKQ
jgi:hypothetical protein